MVDIGSGGGGATSPCLRFHSGCACLTSIIGEHCMTRFECSNI